MTHNNKIQIKTMKDLLKHSIELPIEVLQDINKRIGDWVASGGSMDASYIQQQFRYAENVLNRQVKENLQND